MSYPYPPYQPLQPNLKGGVLGRGRLPMERRPRHLRQRHSLRPGRVLADEDVRPRFRQQRLHLPTHRHRHHPHRRQTGHPRHVSHRGRSLGRFRRRRSLPSRRRVPSGRARRVLRRRRRRRRRVLRRRFFHRHPRPVARARSRVHHRQRFIRQRLASLTPVTDARPRENPSRARAVAKNEK